MKRMFRYEGLNQLKEDMENRSSLLSFKIIDCDTNTVIEEIITNKYLEGRWHETPKGDLVQDAGTSQYSVPNDSQAIRRLLQRKAIYTLREYPDDIRFENITSAHMSELKSRLASLLSK